MPHTFANTLFSAPVKALQERHGSRDAYAKMALGGLEEQALGADEVDFIAARDSFYLATVTPDGWPYIQHRGGPAGFLHVVNEHTLAFADYVGNKQYISTGNLEENDRVALFLMDYPNRTRLKLIARGCVIEPGSQPALERRLLHAPGARIDRIFVLTVAGFDWNCSQHITPRYSREELKNIIPG